MGGCWNVALPIDFKKNNTVITVITHVRFINFYWGDSRVDNESKSLFNFLLAL
jgi:hypothetical protein